jgi:hypothetical protein
VIVLVVALLFPLGFLIWRIERPAGDTRDATRDTVTSLLDGLYWAAVTMTTVGYGDKTPKTHLGRFVAVVWMLCSVALMTFLSANVVSRLTADRVENVIRNDGDLRGKKLAAVALSSGAEFLDGLRLKHKTYANLQDALESLARGESDVVVNSEGALRYLVSERFSNVIRVPRVQLAPAYMGVALPDGSALKKPIDRALIKITESAEWNQSRSGISENRGYDKSGLRSNEPSATCFKTMERYRRPMVPAPRLLGPLARTRVDFLDRRRVPFTRQRIAFWRIEPHGQVEGSLWRWKPIGFHVRVGTLVLEINIERTFRVILERHPAADRETVEPICDLKTVRIIERDRPERFDGRGLPLVEVKHIIVRAVERLAGIVTEIKRVDRILGQVGTEA